jgi:hypothetical protein
MTQTTMGLKALGRAARQRIPLDTQMPVDVQMALLRLAIGERELAVERPRSQAEPATEHDHENGNAPQEACLAG